MSERKIILFGNKTAGIYRLSEIFNPDVDGVDPEAAGKIVPALYSQVIDDVNYRRNKLYTVVALDETNFKATLIPTEITAYGDQERIVSYGNDAYMLYYIQASNKIIVDNKLTFFGDQGVKFQIIRINSDGTTTLISNYKEPGTAATTIDLEISPITGAKTCGACYTDKALNEGDILRLNILDDSDVAVASLQLIVKDAFGVHEEDTNPIVGLDAFSNQMLDDGRFAICKDQDIKTMGFGVEVEYADGTKVREDIDYVLAHMYGLEEVESGITGSTYELLFKRYLPSSDHNVNFASCTKTLEVVIPEHPYGISKISVIPVWDDTLKQWDIKYLGYNRDRAISPEYVSPVVSGYQEHVFDKMQTITLNTTVENPFDVNEEYKQVYTLQLKTPARIVFNGLTYVFEGGSGATRVWSVTPSPNTVKKIIYSVGGSRWAQTTNGYTDFYSTTTSGDNGPWLGNLIWYNNSGVESPYKCSVYEEVLHNMSIANWVIGIPDNSIKYGLMSTGYIRPVICYSRKVNTSTYVYNIPASRFGTDTIGLSNFLNNFYYNAHPPKNLDDTTVTKPTHFTIKDSDTLATKLTSPLAVEDWNNNLAIADNNSYSGKTVIVEFLLKVDNQYEILYGVPVEIKTTTNFT